MDEKKSVMMDLPGDDLLDFRILSESERASSKRCSKVDCHHNGIVLLRIACQFAASVGLTCSRKVSSHIAGVISRGLVSTARRRRRARDRDLLLAWWVHCV